MQLVLYVKGQWASCRCGPLLLLVQIVRWRQYICTHFPIHFTNFIYFTVSAASTFLFRTGGHFPAVGDRLRQAPLAKNGPGGPFLAGDTYLRDRSLVSANPPSRVSISATVCLSNFNQRPSGAYSCKPFICAI